MKIDLSNIDREQFLVHEHIIAGESCWLVQPQHIGAKWNKTNLHFRSSLWNSVGELISASFPKFFNWGEQPDLVSTPNALDNDVELLEKIDGSTLIVSKYGDATIIRTRGTSDASKLDNGHEIAYFKAKYPRIFDNMKDGYSLLFEWTSPLNKIVIDYGIEPDLTLIGAIHHDTYRLWSQTELDILSGLIGVKRPTRYVFNTLGEMIKAVEAFKGKEGVCAYFNNGQDIRKIKAETYLSKHRFKEHASLPNVLDLWFAQNKPDKKTFEDNLVKAFDFECMQMVAPFIEKVCDNYMQLQFHFLILESAIKPLRMTNRKEAAAFIFKNYPDLQAVGFKMLDGREIDDKLLRKIMENRLGL